MKEPIIVKKEAFQAIGVSITTTNEKEASTEGRIPIFGTATFKNKSCITSQINKQKKHSLSIQTTNQMKLVHINLRLVCPFLH